MRSVGCWVVGRAATSIRIRHGGLKQHDDPARCTLLTIRCPRCESGVFSLCHHSYWPLSIVAFSRATRGNRGIERKSKNYFVSCWRLDRSTRERRGDGIVDTSGDPAQAQRLRGSFIGLFAFLPRLSVSLTLIELPSYWRWKWRN